VILVGLGGRMGAGKDTAAGVLCREFGFVRLGFADALKAEVRTLYPRTLRAMARLHYGVTEWSSHTAAEAVVAQLLVDKPPVIRAWLQEHGTEVRREEAPDYWINRLHRALDRLDDQARVVVPDVRFPNEAEYLHHRGACLALVMRGEAFDPDAHPSESHGDAIAWDAVWLNDDTREGFEARVRDWAKEARTSGRL
jgi:hypothetical protein